MAMSKQKWKALLKQCLLINLAATIAATIFNLPLFGLNAFSFREIVSTFVYSNCIGTCTLLTVIFIASRWHKHDLFFSLAKVSFAIFISTICGIFIARLILGLMFSSLYEEGLIPSWQNFAFSLGIALVFGIASYFYEISQSQLRQKELDEEKAKTLATEAQLASLESRIHPHFLFNTLNSIAALIREDPILAEKTVEKLSALLRYSLDENTKSLVSLKQELEITEKYLEIEKIRFDKRLSYKIECEPQFFETKIPPLSLQTLVENSIKHVASKTSAQTDITVSVATNGKNIKIKVCDNGIGFSKDNLKENHGLDNLDKRLKTIFKNQADLQILKDECCVCLSLPK